MFDCLDSRYVIKGELRLMGPLAVSTGEANEYTDLPVMKRLDDTPFIPGSSFRGALRATVERILYSLGWGNVCLLGANPDPEIKSCAEKDEEINRFIESDQDRKKTESEVLEKALNSLCPACLLFGSTILASRLKVSDLLFIRNGDAQVPVTLRHRVAIDRDRDTAKDGAKFDNEVVESGRFEMELIIENASNRDLGILGIALLELLDGNFWVGGDRAVGAGRCKLVDPGIYFFRKDGPSLRDFLKARGSGLDRYPGKHTGQAAEDFIRDKVESFIQEIPHA